MNERMIYVVPLLRVRGNVPCGRNRAIVRCAVGRRRYGANCNRIFTLYPTVTRANIGLVDVSKLCQIEPPRTDLLTLFISAGPSTALSIQGKTPSQWEAEGHKVVPSPRCMGGSKADPSM